MAGIKAVVQDLLAKLNTVEGVKYVRVWNNQLDDLMNKEQDVESFPLPAAFLEVEMPNNYLPLPYGISASDIVFKVHLLHEHYDSEDGTMGQNLSVFDLRDGIIIKLTNYEPVSCGALMKIQEQQDSEHANVYHYIISFTCHFIDDTADARKNLITKDPPTDLQVDASIVNSI